MTWTPQQAGELIERIIIRRSMSVEALGRLPGVSTATIRRIIRGEIDKTTVSSLGQLESKLDLPVATIPAIIEGRADIIAGLPWRDDDYYLREYILSALPGKRNVHRKRA